jgi:hypothetical protein
MFFGMLVRFGVDVNGQWGRIQGEIGEGDGNLLCENLCEKNFPIWLALFFSPVAFGGISAIRFTDRRLVRCGNISCDRFAIFCSSESKRPQYVVDIPS